MFLFNQANIFNYVMIVVIGKKTYAYIFMRL